MTMNDLCRKVNCKHITWSNGGGDSCTAWLECKLHKEATDENHKYEEYCNKKIKPPQ